MAKRIVIFNIVYYTLTLVFIMMGRHDPSSSLGYGFFVVGFWVISAVALVALLARKIICPKSILDKVGVFTATPILSIVVVCIILSFSDREVSESYFERGNYRYRIKTIYYQGSDKVKRIEFYRSSSDNPDVWLRDSTWIYFSESGDTIKQLEYRNDIEIK